MKKLIAFIIVLLVAGVPYSQTVKINICLIQNKVLKTVEADYNQSTGDTTVMANGSQKFFSKVYPLSGKEYAGGTDWFINNEKISGKGKSYVKYGLPRVLGVSEITRISEYKGVGVYAESGSSGVPEVIYIPVKSGCEFQPYQVVVKN